jgi:rhodanese-related sulfurtransferase
MLRNAQPHAKQSKTSSATTEESLAPVVLDVRNGYEWDAGHFEGAKRPPEDEFNETPRGSGTEEDGVHIPEGLQGVDPARPVMVRFLKTSLSMKYCPTRIAH